MTYEADQTYMSSVSTNGTVVATVPASCLMFAGQPLTCGQLQAVLLSLNPGLQANCTGSSSCVCTLTLPDITAAESGTYTTAATGLLTETPSGSTIPSQVDYCVKGASQTLSPRSGFTALGTGITGVVVLAKQ